MLRLSMVSSLARMETIFNYTKSLINGLLRDLSNLMLTSLEIRMKRIIGLLEIMQLRPLMFVQKLLALLLREFLTQNSVSHLISMFSMMPIHLTLVSITKVDSTITQITVIAQQIPTVNFSSLKTSMVEVFAILITLVSIIVMAILLTVLQVKLLLMNTSSCKLSLKLHIRVCFSLVMFIMMVL